MNRALALAIACLAVTGCKKKMASGEDLVIAMTRFSNDMCKCLDRACADAVQDRYNRWASEQSRTAPESQAPQLTELVKRYSDCMMTAMGQGPGASAPPTPAPAAVSLDVTTLLHRIRDKVATQKRKLAISSLEIKYVRADGKLDAEYGRFEMAYRVPPAPPADDSKRPVGAPLPPPPGDQTAMDCPSFGVRDGQLIEGTTMCMGIELIAPPRCTVAQVWARAIADQAPKDALATLTLHGAMEPTPQSWLFTISDPPRNIDIKTSYPDDCEPVLERQ